MGTVTEVDFAATRAAKPAAKIYDFTWADQLAALWYSRPVRILAAALTFAVIMTGLGLLVFALVMLRGVQ